MSILPRSVTRLPLSAIWTFSTTVAGPSRLPPLACHAARRGLKARHSCRLLIPGTRASSTAPTSPRGLPGTSHPHPAFETLSTALSASQPCFGARGDEITLLSSPPEFKAKLLEMIKRAKRKILISTLYIGVEEEELVDAIKTALTARPHLKVAFIHDYHRATRLSPSSKYPPSTAHLLLPLTEEFPDRCEVWLFRSPKLRGLMEKIVPERYDEGWGTWHGKWYCVDDELMLSGANLATSYFTNRQDRYIHFRSHPSFISYLSSLTRLYTHYSYLLSASPPASINRNHLVALESPPTGSKLAALIWPSQSIQPRHFEAHAKATLTAFQNSWRLSNASRMRRVDVDTWFWPVIQAGFLGMQEEERALAKLWEAVKGSHDGQEAGVEVDLTSGYFGLYAAYKRAVINSPAPFRVIAASPKANGFYGSKGLSRLIPEGYTLLERKFHRDAVARGRDWDPVTKRGVRLREWGRDGWTYHSKGIWLSPPQAPSHPFLTFIGSSNLSNRSILLDTELSLLLLTSSPSLRRALHAEVRNLDEHSVDVGEKTWASEERRVSWLAKILVMLGVEDML